jgi:hypothetical protein
MFSKPCEPALSSAPGLTDISGSDTRLALPVSLAQFAPLALF